jgi:hypothetical protein
VVPAALGAAPGPAPQLHHWSVVIPSSDSRIEVRGIGRGDRLGRDPAWVIGPAIGLGVIRAWLISPGDRPG